MKKIAAVISEFNPFHNGHKYLIEKAREDGAAYIISVMSGNFIQRGAPAAAEKRLRAEMALLGGIDLVIELPTLYAAAPAARFAYGAVHLLKSLGVADCLFFGSESGDLESLVKTARLVDSAEINSGIRKYLAEGFTFARARQLAFCDVHGQLGDVLSAPNNNLAVEYIRQADKLCWDVQFKTYLRKNVNHDSHLPMAQYASASLIRDLITGKRNFLEYVPAEIVPVYERALYDGAMPYDYEKYGEAVLSYLRRLKLSDYRSLPDISEGIENRLYSAVRLAVSLDDAVERIKTKRYTRARIRRLLLNAYLGITGDMYVNPPPYARVLSMSRGGAEILGLMKKTASIPFGTSLKKLAKHSAVCREFAYIEERATDLYTQFLPKPLACGYEYYGSAVFMKD